MMRRFPRKRYMLLTDACWFIAVALVICTALWWLTQQPVFWLRGIDVEVEGNTAAITAKGLAEELKDKVHGTFFTADIQEIRDVLKEIPWVKSVSVSREWPNRIAVKLVLHKPIARWGDDSLLTEDGKIFPTNTAIAEGEDELPILSGPEKRGLMIYDRFKLLNAVCKRYQAHAVGLSLDEFGGWRLGIQKENGTPLDIMFSPTETSVGMQGILNKVLREMAQFRTYFGREPQKIDARYERGVVVEKPEEDAAPDGQPDEEGEQKNGR